MKTSKMQTSHVAKLTAIRRVIDAGVTTKRQEMALLAIDFDPRIKTTELAKILNTTRSNIRALMVQLSEKGLVILQHEGGKRGTATCRYSLTHKAQDILDDIFK
nr:hypothetical protein [uncultured Mediterranean phage uvMED]